MVQKTTQVVSLDSQLEEKINKTELKDIYLVSCVHGNS